MDKTIKKFNECMTEIRNQEWKYCALLDVDHDIIISGNKQTGKSTIEPKLKEIERKYKNLPDGIYCLICSNGYGNKFKKTNYYFGKGKFDAKELKEPEPAPIKNKEVEHKEEKNALSFQQAIDNVKTIEELKNMNKLLCERLDRIEKEKAELEHELSEEPESSMADFGASIASWLKEATPTLVPVLDRYFDLQKQKQEFNQMKFLAEKGFEIPGMKRIERPIAETKNKVEVKEIPAPGTPDWLQFVSYVMQMPEKDFEPFMDKMEAERPEIFKALEEIVYE